MVNVRYSPSAPFSKENSAGSVDAGTQTRRGACCEQASIAQKHPSPARLGCQDSQGNCHGSLVPADLHRKSSVSSTGPGLRFPGGGGLKIIPFFFASTSSPFSRQSNALGHFCGGDYFQTRKLAPENENERMRMFFFETRDCDVCSKCHHFPKKSTSLKMCICLPISVYVYMSPISVSAGVGR